MQKSPPKKLSSDFGKAKFPLYTDHCKLGMVELVRLHIRSKGWIEHHRTHRAAFGTKLFLARVQNHLIFIGAQFQGFRTWALRGVFRATTGGDGQFWKPWRRVLFTGIGGSNQKFVHIGLDQFKFK